MEKFNFWVKFFGSIFLIYHVGLVVAEIIDDGWKTFVLKYKRKLNGSERREKRETAKKVAVRRKIEDKKRAVQRKIEEEKKESPSADD